MSDETFNIEELLVRILANRASQEEILYFSKWIEERENRVYFEKLKKLWNLSSGGHANQEMFIAGVKDYYRFMENTLKPKRRVRGIRRIASVAAVVAVALTSVLWFSRTRENTPVKLKNEICQTGGIILRLADNKEVNVLDDSLQLTGGTGGSVRINRTNQREIVYEVQDALEMAGETELAYNQIIVPVGERFSVRLSDGTKAWINSESSLRYPTRFGKDCREVEARGNVYFEVAKDTTRPFVVVSREIKTEVLGTHFEVNTYGDRGEISATLVEGKIRVSVGSRSVIVEPDQQFIFNTKNGCINVVKVDAFNKVRWKDGILVIDNEQFDDVVWKLERWYGVSIVNETGLVFNQSFSGEFDREDIQAAIAAVCVNLNITYTIDKDRIILKR